jgi:hypothetical protein
MHTALIFKEQSKLKKLVLRDKGLAQPHDSIQYIEGLPLLTIHNFERKRYSCKLRRIIPNYFVRISQLLLS